MDLDRQPLVQLDSAPEKSDNSDEASSALQETPEQKKKLKTVGFYELEVLQTPECDEAAEDAKSVNSVKDDDDDDHGFSSKKDNFDGAQPREGEEKNPGYLDQVSPCSPQRCQKQNRPTCLCKECVENYLNLCEEFQEPPGIDEQKNEEVQEPPGNEEQKNEEVQGSPGNEEQKNEEVQEPPDIEEQKNDMFLTYEDSASISSNRSRSESRSSERSKHTNSSGDEYVGQRYEDAQVTLPYPERSQPPECITRLSNAGLYERNEDVAEKGGKEEEDKISQVVSAAFFVKHPDEQFPQKKRVQLEMVDIERGEPECEPLLRTMRRPPEEEEPHPMLCQCSRGCLKIVGSFVASMIVFPAFLYGAYAWLPFDAPLMPDIPTRLVYTMRCAAFATFPLVLGVIIHGISRLCAASYDPFKPREREVTIHRRFVKQGTFLFVLFFFNLSVLATYLHQDYLKMVPLLTCLFALAQLIYWLSFAVTRSFRGFGYGLTFLPLVFMMISNLYYMFVVEPEKMIFIGSKTVPSN